MWLNTVEVLLFRVQNTSPTLTHSECLLLTATTERGSFDANDLLLCPQLTCDQDQDQVELGFLQSDDQETHKPLQSVDGKPFHQFITNLSN